MGDIWLSRPGLSGGTFVDYLERWGMPFEVWPNWDRIGRQSDSGYDAVLGIICHHDAINPSASMRAVWEMSIPPRWGGRRDDGPVGSGTLDHDGVLQLWAAGATNTAGQGGPMLGSRGVIARDNANRTMVSFEARNNGQGEPWTAAQIDRYPLLCAATLDWATHETPGAPLDHGDVWSHAAAGPGWTARKIDPATAGGAPVFGPPTTTAGTWDMHTFRGHVFSRLMAGPPNTGGFLMELSDVEQRDLYNKVVWLFDRTNAITRAPNPGEDPNNTRLLDRADGAYIVEQVNGG